MKRGALLVIAAALVLAGSGILFAKGGHETPLTWPEALEEHFGTPAYKTVDPDKPLYEQARIVSLAGRRFNVPLTYVDAALDRGEVQNGLLLIYVLPNYKSRADFPSRDEYQKAHKAGHFGHLLIEPEAIRPSFDVVLKSRRRRLTSIESAGTFDGLEAEKWYRRYGEKLEHVSDVYLEKDSSGRIVSWIECSTDESAVVPHCSHRFRDKALLYKVHYNRANYLTSWQAQRASATTFIDKFEIPKSHSKKGN